MIPLYLFLDWGLRQILDVSFGLAQRPDDLKIAVDGVGLGNNVDRIEYEDDLSIPDEEDIVDDPQYKPTGSSDRRGI